MNDIEMLKATALDFALRCKQSVDLRREDGGMVCTTSEPIDLRPPLEIAKEIFGWLSEKTEPVKA